MTRINANIPPANLCDKHLLAEHREIIRVRHAQLSSSKAPKEFKLGKGHVLFFKDKLGYIYNRYNQLYAECKRRNFDVEPYHILFDEFDLSGQWVATEQAKGLLHERISERLHEMEAKGEQPRYMSKPISVAEALNILYYHKLPARVA